ncbi:hypothetical protein HHI36_017298 [Cryptolaemus montrouzieri]|uniref:Uncharacterized protein n=1 Tax=Cryptolaemus montrouzieri TaxID=559131 RepID=A0ABD2NME5_9CUCU
MNNLTFHFRKNQRPKQRRKGEKDKDEDSCVEPSKNSLPPVDLPAVRRAFTALFKLKTSIFENALVNALVTLAGNLQVQLPTRKDKDNQDDVVNVLLIVFEIPALGSGDFLETGLPAICRASQWLTAGVQAKLAKIWSSPFGRSSLRNILENLQQLITLKVIVTQFDRSFIVQDENVITSATKLIKILYYANILAGVLESSSIPEELPISVVDESHPSAKAHKAVPHIDPLADELGIHVLNCRKPYLPFEEFYNELLSDAVEMDRDFANYKSELGEFNKVN